MRGIFALSTALLATALLAACAPPPQETTMPSSPAASPATDSPAAAAGRRILSTAFVRVGPDGYLTVELHGGQVLVLRNVTMGPKDFCGTLVSSEPATKKYCGDYAQVAAARAGGGPVSAEPDLAAPNRPAKPE